jgi:serine/threonine-protein kinase SRK2
VEREILNHRQLVHPHIVQFKEVFLTQRYLCIAMEYAAGGDMFEYVVRKGGLRESEARWFFQQLVIAIDYTHRMGVANRDIKLENTLLDGSPRPLIKICDFG